MHLLLGLGHLGQVIGIHLLVLQGFLRKLFQIVSQFLEIIGNISLFLFLTTDLFIGEIALHLLGVFLLSLAGGLKEVFLSANEVIQFRHLAFKILLNNLGVFFRAQDINLKWQRAAGAFAAIIILRRGVNVHHHAFLQLEFARIKQVGGITSQIARFEFP